PAPPRNRWPRRRGRRPPNAPPASRPPALARPGRRAARRLVARQGGPATPEWQRVRAGSWGIPCDGISRSPAEGIAGVFVKHVGRGAHLPWRRAAVSRSCVGPALRRPAASRPGTGGDPTPVGRDKPGPTKKKRPPRPRGAAPRFPAPVGPALRRPAESRPGTGGDPTPVGRDKPGPTKKKRKDLRAPEAPRRGSPLLWGRLYAGQRSRVRRPALSPPPSAGIGPAPHRRKEMTSALPGRRAAVPRSCGAGFTPASGVASGHRW